MHTCMACDRAIDFAARDMTLAPRGDVHRDGIACSRARHVARWGFEPGASAWGNTWRRRPSSGPVEPDHDAT